MHEQNGQDVAGEIFLADIARSVVFDQPETAGARGQEKAFAKFVYRPSDLLEDGFSIPLELTNSGCLSELNEQAMLCVGFLYRALNTINAGKGEREVHHDAVAQFL